MSSLKCNGTSGEVAFSSTPKSVNQIKAPTNQRIAITELSFMGKQPAGGADTPVKVRVTYSSANFGTFSGGVYVKEDQTNPETPTATFGGVASVEPTTPTDLGRYFEVPPQIGILIIPLDPPLIVPGGKSIQFEVTASGSETPTLVCNCRTDE